MQDDQNVSPQVGVFKGLVNRGRLVLHLIRDGRVPIYLKIVPFLGALYILSPLDFIPDIAPVLGQLDDLGIILVSVELFIALCPPNVVEEHRAEIEGREFYSTTNKNTGKASRSDTIEGEWRVKQ